jgi:dTDP-4-amino-4,6-dideoxygalactose transaminase
MMQGETVNDAGIRRAAVHSTRPVADAEQAPIPLHRPDLGAAEEAAAARVLRSGWVSQGPEAEAFEREFAAFTGAAHAVAVSSGTAGLELALQALGIGAGDDVVTVSHSFVATANAIRNAGARPVFVDIERATFNLDPARIEAALSPNTRAILAVHQLGMPCDLAAIAAIARARGLALIEDAACAAGSEVLWEGRWERIGRPHGDIACFSFHGRKPITTGEGGMVTTARDDLAEAVRALADHGVSSRAHLRHASRGAARERYAAPGSNRRLSDIQAAIGRTQLQRLPALVARRRTLAVRYRASLAGSRHAAPPAEPAWACSNWQSYCVRLADGIGRDRAIERLAARGIAARPGVMCAHLEPSWPKESWRAAGPLAESEAARARCILLPLFPSLSDADQERVVAALAEACAP